MSTKADQLTSGPNEARNHTFIAQPKSSPQTPATRASPSGRRQIGRSSAPVRPARPERHLGRRPGALAEEAVRDQARDRADGQPGAGAEGRPRDDADDGHRLHAREGREEHPSGRRHRAQGGDQRELLGAVAAALERHHAERQRDDQHQDDGERGAHGAASAGAGRAASAGRRRPSPAPRRRPRAAKPASWVATSTAAPSAARARTSAASAALRAGVHAAGGLVERDHRRAGGQDRRQGHALALAHREVQRVAGRQAAEAEGLERLGDPRAPLGPAQAQPPQGEAHLVVDALGEQVAPGVLAHEPDAGSAARRAAPSRPAGQQHGPAAGRCSPASTRRRVVLPQPLGPARVVTWPACSSRDAPRRTGRPGWPASTPSSAARTGPRGRRGRRGSAGGRGGLDAPAAHRDGAVGHGAGPVGAVLGQRDGDPRRRPAAQRRRPAPPPPASSSWEVGSSISSTAGRGARTAARATRWRSPPERVAIARPARCAAPARSRASRTRPGIAAAGTPRLQAEGHVAAHRPEHRLALGVLEHHPGQAGDPRRRRAQRVVAADRHPPREAPPWKCGTSPQSARRSVDLPSPEGPSSSSTSPAASSRSTPSRAGAPASP